MKNTNREEQIKQIEAFIASNCDEFDEVCNAIYEVENEEGDEDELTPQAHLDYLYDEKERLENEYAELKSRLEELKAAVA